MMSQVGIEPSILHQLWHQVDNHKLSLSPFNDNFILSQSMFIAWIIDFFWRNVFLGANLSKFTFSMGEIQQLFLFQIQKKKNP